MWRAIQRVKSQPRVVFHARLATPDRWRRKRLPCCDCLPSHSPRTLYTTHRNLLSNQANMPCKEPSRVTFTFLPRSFSTQPHSSKVVTSSQQSTSSSASSKPSSGRRQKQNHPNATSFLESWTSVADYLLTRPVGTWEKKDWSDSVHSILQLRSNFALLIQQQQDLDPQPILSGLDILNRQCQELEMYRKYPEALTLPVKLPLDDLTLAAVLIAWRDWISLTKNHKGRTNNQILKYRKNELHPSSVVQRLKHYLEQGLFEPEVPIFNIFLHATAKSADVQSFQVAKEVYEQMLQRSKHDPFDIARHPDEETICHLIDISTQVQPKEAPQNADMLFDQVQQWHQQTKLAVYRGHSQLYCLVMEAHSRNNGPDIACDRILELFELMRRRSAGLLDEIACNRTCHALANIRHHPQKRHITAARAILDLMCKSLKQETSTKRSDETSDTDRLPAPSNVTFLAVLTAYARAGMAKEAQELFDYMVQLSDRTNQDNLRPTAKIYSALIWAYAKTGDTDQTNRIMQRMLEAAEQGKDGFDQMNPHIWGGLMASWAESGDPQASKNILEIMRKLSEMAEKHNVDMVDTNTFNILLSSHARQRGPNATRGAREAEKLLNWMHEHNNSKIRPDGNSYLNVIHAWSNAGVPDKCESHLRKLFEHMAQGKVPPDTLDTIHFNVVMEAWRNSKHPQAAEKAKTIFDRMKQLRIQPDCYTYNSAIWACGQMRNGDPSQMALSFFEEMLNQWKSGDELARPNEMTYNAVLHSLSKSSDPSATQTAEAIFQQMLVDLSEPNISVFNTLMLVYSRHGQPERVEEIFQELRRSSKEKGKEARRPTHVLYRTRLQAWSKAGDPERAAMALNEFIREFSSLQEMPGRSDFTAVLNAWLLSDRPESWKKVERGLYQMVELAREGKFDCFPNISTMGSVLAAYSKANEELLPNPGERASFLFEDIKRWAEEDPKNRNIQPNFAIYNAVMAAWLHQKEPAPVEQLFQEAKKRFGRADKSLHKARIRAWSMTGHPEDTRSAVNEWLEFAKQTGEEPNRTDFYSLLLAWSKSGRADAGEKAEETLREMNELVRSGNQYRECQPNGHSYALAISAYAQSGSVQAGERVIQLLREYKELGPRDEPDFSTYAEVVTTLARSGHVEGQGEAWKIYKELSLKPDSFWQVGDEQKSLRRMKSVMNTIGQSDWIGKTELFDAFRQLQRACARANNADDPYE